MVIEQQIAERRDKAGAAVAQALERPVGGCGQLEAEPQPRTMLGDSEAAVDAGLSEP
jgi:hypothetical protein